LAAEVYVLAISGFEITNFGERPEPSSIHTYSPPRNGNAIYMFLESIK
jgi:hypothetical protein